MKVALTLILCAILLAVVPADDLQRHHRHATKSHNKNVAALQTKLTNLRKKKQQLQHQL